MAPKYQANKIAEYLEFRERAGHTPARRAGRAIAEAWNDREFWRSATVDPLRRCRADSPGMAPVDEVLRRLTAEFGTHVRDIPGCGPDVPPVRPAQGATRGSRRVGVDDHQPWNDPDHERPLTKQKPGACANRIRVPRGGPAKPAYRVLV
jgi:hypothetical protein